MATGGDSNEPDGQSVYLKQKAYEEFSNHYKKHEGLEIRKIIMKEDHKDETHKVQKLSLGQPTNNPTKIILLVGATGTGKTTLINNMVNYIFRIKFTDHYRFILIDDKDAPARSEAESQTDMITAYVFNHIDGMPFDYNYVLVDTPGFGDTRGIQRDREMMKQLEMFLKQSYGIDSVDGVGFVVQSGAARLTQTQRYVYEGLSSMFGKDVKKNIFVMATFADAKPPPVLEALKQADVKYQGFHKFNNSALYARNKKAETTRDTLNSDSESDSDSDSDSDDDAADICKLFWDMGTKSMDSFFHKLGKTLPASLILTKEVLSERSRLQIVVVGLQKEVQLGLGKLTNLQQEKDMLTRADANVEGFQNYEELVEVPNIIKIDLEPRQNTTNCLRCNMTCHWPCYIPDDAKKMDCWAIDDNGGVCRICPDKCIWDMHKNMSFRYETRYVKENRTIKQLFDRYDEAQQGKNSKEQVVKSIEDAINGSAGKLISLIAEAQAHVERLEEIALKPNPLSTKEYINLMIESEKMQKGPNFEKRIKMLEHLNAEVIVLQGMRGLPNPASGVELYQYFQNLMLE